MIFRKKISMIFSDRLIESKKGQAVVEFLGGTIIVLLILIPTILLLVQALGGIILTKWASKNSHCVAQSRNSSQCGFEVSHSLSQNFAFKHVNVKVKKLRGIIHSEIDAQLLSQSVRGSYDLEPSEYKRVP
jgi:hypothetical protein